VQVRPSAPPHLGDVCPIRYSANAFYKRAGGLAPLPPVSCQRVLFYLRVWPMLPRPPPPSLCPAALCPPPSAVYAIPPFGIQVFLPPPPSGIQVLSVRPPSASAVYVTGATAVTVAAAPHTPPHALSPPPLAAAAAPLASPTPSHPQPPLDGEESRSPWSSLGREESLGPWSHLGRELLYLPLAAERTVLRSIGDEHQNKTRPGGDQKNTRPGPFDRETKTQLDEDESRGVSDTPAEATPTVPGQIQEPSVSPGQPPVPEVSPGQKTDVSPGQIAAVCPGRVIGVRPGHTANALHGQKVDLVPGQMNDLCPGQTADVLPNQMTNLSPGQAAIPDLTPNQVNDAPPDQTADILPGQLPAFRTVCALIACSTAHAPSFSKGGAAPPVGLLLYGPPGGGKTHLVARAAAAFRVPLVSLDSSHLDSSQHGSSQHGSSQHGSSQHGSSHLGSSLSGLGPPGGRRNAGVGQGAVNVAVNGAGFWSGAGAGVAEGDTCGGAGAARLRRAFGAAAAASVQATAAAGRLVPGILFIDELDTWCPSVGEQESARLVTPPHRLIIDELIQGYTPGTQPPLPPHQPPTQLLPPPPHKGTTLEQHPWESRASHNTTPRTLLSWTPHPHSLCIHVVPVSRGARERLSNPTPYPLPQS
jgi:hypothetical protein